MALGILMGCEASSLADVSNLCTEYPKFCDIYSDVRCAFNIAIKDIPKGKSCNIYVENVTISLEDRVSKVFGSDIIVGYSSFETYLGCCLKKPVVEIQLDACLYKWSNPKYVCITDDSNLKELVKKGIAICLS
jgi:hypothetical protein